MRVAPIPAELVLFVRRHVHVLEVAVRLLIVAAVSVLGLGLLGEGEGPCQGHAEGQEKLEEENDALVRLLDSTIRFTAMLVVMVSSFFVKSSV